MGLLRMIFGAIVVWFVWRLLDGFLGGGRKPHPREQPKEGPRRKPDDAKIGEYVDFEEIKD